MLGHGAAGSTKCGDGAVESAQPLVEQIWLAEDLTVFNIPLVSGTLVGGRAGSTCEVLGTRATKREGALDSAEYIALLSTTVPKGSF